MLALTRSQRRVDMESIAYLRLNLLQVKMACKSALIYFAQPPLCLIHLYTNP